MGSFEIMNYKTFITSDRFDLMAKYLYIKHYDKKIHTNFFIKLYKSHINTFNGCYEYPGTKTNIQQFIESFNALIESIKTNNFNKDFPIPIGSNNVIINGSHRLMVSYFLKKKIYVIFKSNIACPYNYSFFLNRKEFPSLQPIYADTMALEYININSNIRIMCVYPKAYNINNINIIKNIISKYGYIYYEKSVQLNKNGFNNLIKELYRGEKWIGGLFPTGISEKTKLCFDNKPTTIFLIDMKDTSKLIEMKEKCRSLYKLNKHSLHVSDYTKDTFRIASSILNKNSIHFLNNGTNDITMNTKLLLNKFFNEVKLNKEDFCLTSSLIMEMYCLRKAKDIDYLHKDNMEINLKDVGLHSGKWEEYYHIHKDEIIYNPNNHFYFNGSKFATLNVIKKMKENRGELKDLIDIKLIEKINYINYF